LRENCISEKIEEFQFEEVRVQEEVPEGVLEIIRCQDFRQRSPECWKEDQLPRGRIKCALRVI
jgi:hypothetical protein